MNLKKLESLQKRCDNIIKRWDNITERWEENKEKLDTYHGNKPILKMRPYMGPRLELRNTPRRPFLVSRRYIGIDNINSRQQAVTTAEFGVILV